MAQLIGSTEHRPDLFGETLLKLRDRPTYPGHPLHHDGALDGIDAAIEASLNPLQPIAPSCQDFHRAAHATPPGVKPRFGLLSTVLAMSTVNLHGTAICRGPTARALSPQSSAALYIGPMFDPSTTRALSILATAVAETFDREGLGEVFLAKLMLATEALRSPETADDPALMWADRLAKELLLG